jgi:hypothetical protein
MDVVVISEYQEHQASPTKVNETVKPHWVGSGPTAGTRHGRWSVLAIFFRAPTCRPCKCRSIHSSRSMTERPTRGRTDAGGCRTLPQALSGGGATPRGHPRSHRSHRPECSRPSSSAESAMQAMTSARCQQRTTRTPTNADSALSPLTGATGWIAGDPPCHHGDPNAPTQVGCTTSLTTAASSGGRVRGTAPRTVLGGGSEREAST